MPETRAPMPSVIDNRKYFCPACQGLAVRVGTRGPSQKMEHFLCCQDPGCLAQTWVKAHQLKERT